MFSGSITEKIRKMFIYYFVGFFLSKFCNCLTMEIACIPHNDTHMEETWNLFKRMNNKTYTSTLEERRKEAWIQNCRFIYKHNQEEKSGLHGYTLSQNDLSDLSHPIYERDMVKLTPSRRRKLADDEIVAALHHDPKHIPEAIDWREKGFVTLPLNQKDCGSCYAFSIAHIVQAQVYKLTKNLVPLSEQQIVDCSVISGNYGCSGGSLRNTLRYLDAVGGLETARAYPYVAKTKCKFRKSETVVNLTTWAILPARDEEALKVAVATIGPVAVSINASPQTFQLYSKGIYDDKGCSSNAVNHAMLVVGYTREAWILKNWWGAQWGEQGYMRLRRKKNRCGIANYVAYATVD